MLGALVALAAATGAPSRARADGRSPQPRAEPRPQPATTPGSSDVQPPRWILGLRAFVPVYLGDITMPGGRDYVGATPQGGWGVRFDAAVRPTAGLTIGLAVGYAHNALKPQLLGDTRDTLTDVFGALLLGYRATIANLFVIGTALGVGLHVVRPPGGGWGGVAELEVGVKLHPRIVAGAGVSLEIIGGMSDSTGQVARVTPALVFELLL